MTNSLPSRSPGRVPTAVFGLTGALVLATMLAAMSPSVWAQTTLPDLSLEDLMKLDAGQVVGASERLQPVTEAPASISFITAGEIALYGYQTLADILRGVRGIYVTNDRNYSYAGTRGFGKPGDYNSRILLLVNGHRVNDNIYGQAEIGAEFGLDPAIFERVEIIRGPASALYGDSAFFAVVNVITKTGASLEGASLAFETGTLGARLARATAGHRFTSGVEIALATTIGRSEGVERLYFPAFDAPGSNNGIAEGLDGERLTQFYSRLDFKGLTVTGAYGSRRRDVPTASYDTLFNSQNPPEYTIDRHTLVDAEYGRSFGGTRATFRASIDRYSFTGVFPYPVEPEGSPPLVGESTGLGARWSVGGGLTRAFRGRQTVRAGVEFINNGHQDQFGRYLDPPVVALDSRASSHQHAVYVQDEIKLARWLVVNAGLRYDGYEGFRRVTPRTALIFLPSSMQSLKYLYGRAFRAPNAYESTEFYFGEGVRNLKPESVDTHEFVWEGYFNDWLRTTISTYRYKADRLITLRPDDSALLGTSFVNDGEVRAKGIEFEAQMRLNGESRLLTSYSLQSAVDQQTGAGLPNSPRHLAKVRLTLPGPTKRSTVSLEAQYLSSRKTRSESEVSSATVVNATMVQRLGQSWELFGTVQNVFNARNLDPVSSFNREEAVRQNGRTARIGLKWRLPTK